MKKRFLSIAVCFCLMIACVFSFGACGNEKMTVGKAADKMEPAGAPITALGSTINELTNGTDDDLTDLTGADAEIASITMEALEGVYMFGEMLMVLDQYKEYNEMMKEVGATEDYIVKDGNTYTVEMDGITTIKVKSAKNSVSLEMTMPGETEGETETVTCKFSFAKNYISIQAEMYGTSMTAELKYTKTDMYMHLITEEVEGEGESAVTSYAVLEIKFNYTLVTAEFGDEEYTDATINSFAIFAEEVETAPASIKDVKDFEEFATGEGAVAWTAPVAA